MCSNAIQYCVVDNTMESQSSRPKKTDIVRKRTGCQNCKTRRRKCDETRPECCACVRRGIQCSGYDRPVAFKDVTALAAESSRKFEAARWSALRLEDARRKRRRTAAAEEPSSQVPRSDVAVGSAISAQAPSAPVVFPPGPFTTTESWPGGAFAPSWALFDNFGLNLLQDNSIGVESTETTGFEELSTPIPGQTPCETISPDDSPPEATSPTNWDEFLVSHDSPANSSPSDESLLGEPTTDLQISLPLEESLVKHFDTNVIPAIPVTLAFSNLFQKSSCFRAAVLALSASHLKLAERLPLDFHMIRRICDDKSVWEYYDSAVRNLQMQLQRTNKGGEELAGAALLLAYHELEAGTAFGILNHASGLDAIASKMDFTAMAVPNLFKAWRMLRYDIRFMMTPTRRTCNPVDNYDAACLLDPQLAIRDILSRVYGLYSRHALEASFKPGKDADGCSASEKVARWLCSSLGRKCDFRNFQRGDFYRDDVTPETILQHCDTFSQRLDAWHQSLCDHDLPTMKLGTEGDLITGPTFEPVVAYRFADDSKAVDYLLYLVARMAISNLRSVFGTSVTAAATDALAKAVLGIICGIDVLQRRQFTVLRFDVILMFVATISESTTFARTILDYLIPKIMGAGLTASEIVSWAYFKSLMELWLREKLRGRALRFMLTGMDDDSDPCDSEMADQTRYGIRDVSLFLLDTGYNVADNVFGKPPGHDFDLLLNSPDLARLPGLRFDYSSSGMDTLIAGAFWQLLAFFRRDEGSLGDLRHSLAKRLRHYFTQVVDLVQSHASAMIPRVDFARELNEVLRSEPYQVLHQQFWEAQRDPLIFHLALIKIFLRARTAFLVKPVVTVIEAANTEVCMGLTDVLDNLAIILLARRIRFQGVQEAGFDSIEEAESSLSVIGDTYSSAVPTPTTSTAPSEDFDRVPRQETECSGSSAAGDAEPKQANPESQEDEQVEQRATDPSTVILRLEGFLASVKQSLKEQLFTSQKQNAALRARVLTQERDLAACRVAKERLWGALRKKTNEELREQGIMGRWNSEDVDAFHSLEHVVEEDT
ncbi:C6 zinc finger domain protein [Colletotrichum karsti]|uniref:C6 zinc finger domain protein n=1 Tax=Colletotrichum karsti TaxID=1095194 RepID=A0A9P6LHK7_9PEZI|nr:C6 zinc finger domain protein [Colletotrichum karsti]KAF9873271.1 C6 zinc finger domain protein [Colletotrichum karsti]